MFYFNLIFTIYIIRPSSFIVFLIIIYSLLPSIRCSIFVRHSVFYFPQVECRENNCFSYLAVRNRFLNTIIVEIKKNHYSFIQDTKIFF